MVILGGWVFLVSEVTLYQPLLTCEPFCKGVLHGTKRDKALLTCCLRESRTP